MKKERIDFRIVMLFSLAIFCVGNSQAQSKTIKVKPFEKVVIHPHIEVVFRQGEEESVQIKSAWVSRDQVNIDVHGKTLELYIGDHKHDWSDDKDMFNGTKLVAIITYKELSDLSLRGSESFLFESPLKSKNLRLKVYGESEVTFNRVNFYDFHSTIYGETFLKIKSGKIAHQKYTVYGESEVNTMGIKNLSTDVMVFGEADFRFNVSESLKVSTFGEASIAYQGNPKVRKGLILGEVDIHKTH